ALEGRPEGGLAEAWLSVVTQLEPTAGAIAGLSEEGTVGHGHARIACRAAGQGHTRPAGRTPSSPGDPGQNEHGQACAAKPPRPPPPHANVPFTLCSSFCRRGAGLPPRSREAARCGQRSRTALPGSRTRNG